MNGILAVCGDDVKCYQRSADNVSKLLQSNGPKPGITLARMIACTDVHYTDTHALAACILFHAWADENADFAVTERVEDAAPYEPGRFYRRELPPLLSVISKLAVRPKVIIIDGYVWLGNWDHPGLGAHLHKALDETVIGVAKNPFRFGPAVRSVRRGTSTRPIYVSAAGMDLNEATACIVGLHGEIRVPTLLKRVDRLCRGRLNAVASDLPTATDH